MRVLHPLRIDSVLLRSGYVVSAVSAGLLFIAGLNWSLALGTVVAGALFTRIAVYIYFERFLAFRTFQNFASGKVKHECVACGASCHLRVNLEKSDMERVLKHAEETGMKETVVEMSGNKYWLARKSDHSCVFLTYSGNMPRCSIYSIRPIACRLFPLIPTGKRLKVDPLCPGLSKERGHTFREHLATQEVGPYVRKVMGKI
jgi:Fe-S-cluster containining protein